MPFVVTLLILFIFLFGAYRLVQIMGRLRNGKLQINRQRGLLLSACTVLAYLALAFATALVCAGYAYLVWGLFQPKFPLNHLIPIFVTIFAYPGIFFGAEWIFYYGFTSDQAMR